MAATSTPTTKLFLTVATCLAQGTGAMKLDLKLGISKEIYTSNAVCREQYCTNPLFPGLNDLPRLEQISWQCQSTESTRSLLNFCKDAVVYQPALPSPNSTGTALDLLIKAQDDAAATMFFYHLNGLGYEAWDHQNPSKSTDPCVLATWRMTCYTYFPKAQAGCVTGQVTPYMRPCKDCCENYLAKCQVECCDESPQCVFQHAETSEGTTLMQTGYTDAVGPSASCTGLGFSAGRGLSAPIGLLLALLGFHIAAASTDEAPRPRMASPATATPQSSSYSVFPAATFKRMTRMSAFCVVLVIAISVQGCDMDIPRHQVGMWRTKMDYLVGYEFVAPGGTPEQAMLNSCSQIGISETLQCSGRGYCKAFDSANTMSSLAFCSCDRDYTDPECRTKRKSQVKAYLFSLFGGLLGMDYFYLGLPLWGIAKLCTFGGFGFWWLVDIIRTGSGPVYAHDFRVANDLPHWVFMVSTLSLFMVLGFVYSIYSFLQFRTKKRQNVMMLKESEESRQITKSDELNALGPQYGNAGGAPASFQAPRAFSGYGATLPASLPSGDAPYAQGQLPHGAPGPNSGPYGPYGGPMQHNPQY